MTPATIRDVAKRAGVGVGTVSRVLNASPSVSQATRQKVMEAIEALDYAPNPHCPALILGKDLDGGRYCSLLHPPLFCRTPAWSRACVGRQ